MRKRKKMQSGGMPPIPVTDPNDLRLKKYRDSLRAYNNFINLQDFVRKNPDLNKVGNDPKLLQQYANLGELNAEGNWGENGDNKVILQPSHILHPYPEQFDEMWQFDKPKQPYIYQATDQQSIAPRPIQTPNAPRSLVQGPKRAQFNTIQGSPMIPQAPIDPRSNFSFSGMGSDGQQKSLYFNDLDSWRNATEQMGYSHREVTNNGNSASATGYQFKRGGKLSSGMKKQQGGLWSNNRRGYVDSTLSANSSLDWVKRLYEKNAPTMLVPGESDRSTHYMADDGKGYVFPEVVRQNGELQYLGNRAEDYARQTNTGIQFPTQQGTWFADNGYKIGTNVNNSINPMGTPYNNANYKFLRGGKKGIMQAGGPINTTGYLAGASTVNNSMNVIPGNHITTNGMAFPIMADGGSGPIMLHPNTGDYKFHGANKVAEWPARGMRAKTAKRGGKMTFDPQQNNYRTGMFDTGGIVPLGYPYAGYNEDDRNMSAGMMQSGGIYGPYGEQNHLAELQDWANVFYSNPDYKKGGWIKGAVNPAHKGYCTPMTKSTCTPRRKAFATTMKKHHGFHKKEGGYSEGLVMQQGGQMYIPYPSPAPLGTADSLSNRLNYLAQEPQEIKNSFTNARFRVGPRAYAGQMGALINLDENNALMSNNRDLWNTQMRLSNAQLPPQQFYLPPDTKKGKRKGGYMQQGGTSFTPAGSLIDQNQWAMAPDQTPVSPFMKYAVDPTQQSPAYNPNSSYAQHGQGIHQENSFGVPNLNNLKWMLPLNAGLRITAQGNQNRQTQDYQINNMNNPLSTLARDDGRGQDQMYGYQSYQLGGSMIPSSVPIQQSSELSEAYTLDDINRILATGSHPTNNQLRSPNAPNYLSAYAWSQQMMNKSPEQRIQSWFGRPVDSHNPNDTMRQRLSSFGHGPVAMFNDSPQRDQMLDPLNSLVRQRSGGSIIPRTLQMKGYFRGGGFFR